VGFVVDKVALGRFSPSTSVSPANIIPPSLHIHLSPPHEVCDCSDQAARYHNLAPKLGGFTSDPAHWLETEKERKKKYLKPSVISLNLICFALFRSVAEFVYPL
jgi:hypothetical protein